MVVQKAAATPPLPAAATVSPTADNCYMQQYQKYATHCETADSGNGSDLESNGCPVQQPASLLLSDDSEESGPSSLNSDSLNCSSTEYVRQAASKPSGQLRQQRHKSLRMLGALLPDSLLRDIRDRRSSSSAEYVVQFTSPAEVKDKQLKPVKPVEVQDEQEEEDGEEEGLPTLPSSLRLSRESLNEESIEELRAAVQRANFVQTGEEATASSLPVNSSTTGDSHGNCNSSNNKYKYADDRYYSFHINEHENFSSFARHGDGTRHEQHDVFAGYRDVRSSASSTQSTIRSAKGTVRGVKNRVRNGIATFLQLQQQPNAKVSCNIPIALHCSSLISHASSCPRAIPTLPHQHYCVGVCVFVSVCGVVPGTQRVELMQSPCASWRIVYNCLHASAEKVLPDNCSCCCCCSCCSYCYCCCWFSIYLSHLVFMSLVPSPSPSPSPLGSFCS